MWCTALWCAAATVTLLLALSPTPLHARRLAQSLAVRDNTGHLPAPPPPLPPTCIDTEGIHLADDEACYHALASASTAPYCHGRSSLPGPHVHHTAALTPLPPSFTLFLHSFLATQCCDAVLWLWAPAPLLPGVASFVAEHAPPTLAGDRIVVKLLDLDAQWGLVAADFPDTNSTQLARMTSFTDIRYVSDFVRVVLMYAHGGMWLDVDTVFLRDLTPLHPLVASNGWGGFFYRGGYDAHPNNAVLVVARRPNPISRSLLAHTLRAGDAKPWTIYKWMRPPVITPASPNRRSEFPYLSQLLFEGPLFYRHYAKEVETAGLKRIHPELSGSGGKSWDAFFLTAFNGTTSPSRAEVEGGAPFLPGSFTYHWHNRYELGLGIEGSWAWALSKRYAAALEGKAGCCGGASPVSAPRLMS